MTGVMKNRLGLGLLALWIGCGDEAKGAVGGAMVAAGSALLFDLAAPWEPRLMAVEKALEKACKEEIRDTELRVSTRLDPLLKAVDHEWSADSAPT